MFDRIFGVLKIRSEISFSGFQIKAENGRLMCARYSIF